MWYSSLKSAIVLLAICPGPAIAQTRSETRLPDQPAQAPVRPHAELDQPLVQLAILLDNSGSMSGLIEQAKTELWRVVNELTTARQHGRQPQLQVALYTYGNPPPQQRSPLTDDLDKVSEALFAVTISGGSEYCGQVIQTATRELEWSERSDDLKLIFIAGNEPFSQGPIDYRDACSAAIARGIMVNTIHCGDGIPEDWREGALLADGRAMSINQDAQLAYVEAPQDAEITRLSSELNSTYLPFGTAATEGQTRQLAQDVNAQNQSAGSSVQRAVSKANAFYRNSTWDLVDAVQDGSVELAEIEADDLPEQMRKMTPAERRQYVQQQTVARQRIQEQINQLNDQRNRYVAAKRREQAENAEQRTLDQVLVESIREQAAAKAFQFEQ